MCTSQQLSEVFPQRKIQRKCESGGEEEKKCGHIPVSNCLCTKFDNTVDIFIKKTMIVYKILRAL